jgi:hypothetical protein
LKCFEIFPDTILSGIGILPDMIIQLGRDFLLRPAPRFFVEMSPYISNEYRVREASIRGNVLVAPVTGDTKALVLIRDQTPVWPYGLWDIFHALSDPFCEEPHGHFCTLCQKRPKKKNCQHQCPRCYGFIRLEAKQVHEQPLEVLAIGHTRKLRDWSDICPGAERLVCLEPDIPYVITVRRKGNGTTLHKLVYFTGESLLTTTVLRRKIVSFPEWVDEFLSRVA